MMKIFPLGENALTVEFGDVISRELNDVGLSLSASIHKGPFPGFVECVPSYSATTVFYDSMVVRASHPDFETAFDAVRSVIEARLPDLEAFDAVQKRIVEIPVDFGKDSALDQATASQILNTSFEEILEIFLDRTYRVYMLGFLPGFAYMGEVDERIAMARRETPRTKVPKGSVGIAGRQTGIYPLESPGGWQIIGRTVTEMFDRSKDEPCLLSPGDEVKFIRA